MHEEDSLDSQNEQFLAFFFFFFKNRWQDSSKEKPEATSEPTGVTQSSTHHPPEQCNGSQRDSWEGADYRQDGRAAVQPPCKDQELDGSTTQSVDDSPPARLCPPPYA